jgi:hypothetical protein
MAASNPAVTPATAAPAAASHHPAARPVGASLPNSTITTPSTAPRPAATPPAAQPAAEPSAAASRGPDPRVVALMRKHVPKVISAAQDYATIWENMRIEALMQFPDEGEVARYFHALIMSALKDMTPEDAQTYYGISRGKFDLWQKYWRPPAKIRPID